MAKTNVAKKTGSVDLGKLFSAVASNLAENRDSLNQADTYNKDHGDNMVGIFQSVAKIVQSKAGTSQAAQLASASKELMKNPSGSAKLYAEGLARASKAFKGKSITPASATDLIQSLLGGGQAASAPVQQEAPAGDLLGSLLGSLTGSEQAGKKDPQPGLDMGDLLNAGMAFMDAKQKGGSTMEAMIGAVLSSSPLGQSSHRSQSGSMVANTIMSVLGAMTKK